MADTVRWPEATLFCGRHFLTRRSAAKPVVPKQGLKKGVAEEAEVSSVARLHGIPTIEDVGMTRRGCDAGAAVLGGRGQGNEHAALRRSAWGAGAELGFSASSVSSAWS